ncbi:MAG: hypothetical protein K8I27_14130 [Planctomycetes bacterium]|nr:hypothetical protein [Planctomycetota bacterium]
MAGQPPQGYPPQQGGYPQQQPYGQQGGGYGPPVKPHRGGMLIAFAILGWFFCIIFAIVAFFMSKTDLAEMQQGIMDRQGEGLTKASYYLSMIAMILAAVGIVLYILMIVVFVGAGGASQM